MLSLAAAHSLRPGLSVVQAFAQSTAKPIALRARLLDVTRWMDALAVVVLVAVGAIAVATFRDYGLGWDDYTQSQYGHLLVSLYSSGFADKRALSFVNLYMYGGGSDILSTLAAKILPIRPVRNTPAGGRHHRSHRPVRHLATDAAAWRSARRPDRILFFLPPARSTTATCSSTARTAHSRLRW